MKKIISLSVVLVLLFSSFTPTKKICGPSFKITNNSSVTITAYQIWELSGTCSTGVVPVSITPGNNYTVPAISCTGTFAVRLLYSTPTSGSMFVWNDMPGEFGCADLYSGSTRTTVTLDISTCDEVLVNLNTFSCL
jgi:hypothetical protein